MFLNIHDIFAFRLSNKKVISVLLFFAEILTFYLLMIVGNMLSWKHLKLTFYFYQLNLFN